MSDATAPETNPPDATFAVRDAAMPSLHVYQPLSFAEAPEWAPFLPVPGTYNHPLYGVLDFSPEAYARVIDNFKNATYQERIPVNAEHDLPASGALGWITDMRIAENGGVDARVEWNARGKTLIADDRFRYVSAEVWNSWTDPVTGVEVADVATGLAICTNPYFKESVLRPLVASEAVLTRVVPSAAVAATEDDGMSDKETPSDTTTAPPPPLEHDDDVTKLTERIMAEIGSSAKITDPVVTQFVEKAARELMEARESERKATEKAKALGEQNAVLAAQNRVKKFTDEVMGHSAESGIAYASAPDAGIPDMVRMFCSLATTYGDASWEVEHYKKLNRAHASQIKAGSLFGEIGSGRGSETTQTAEDQITALARELVAGNPKLTEAQAFTQVLNNNAELRAAHARERHGGR